MSTPSRPVMNRNTREMRRYSGFAMPPLRFAMKTVIVSPPYPAKSIAK